MGSGFPTIGQFQLGFGRRLVLPRECAVCLYTSATLFQLRLPHKSLAFVSPSPSVCAAELCYLPPTLFLSKRKKIPPVFTYCHSHSYCYCYCCCCHCLRLSRVYVVQSHYTHLSNFSLLIPLLLPVGNLSFFTSLYNHVFLV